MLIQCCATASLSCTVTNSRDTFVNVTSPVVDVLAATERTYQQEYTPIKFGAISFKGYDEDESSSVPAPVSVLLVVASLLLLLFLLYNSDCL